MKTRLVVIGDRSTLASLRSVLESEPDFEVTAASPEWAKVAQAMRTNDVDVCLVDVPTHHADAERLISRLREQGPFVTMIALVEEEQASASLRSGIVADMVEKRSLKSDLIRTIHRAIGSSSLRRRISRGLARPVEEIQAFDAAR